MLTGGVLEATELNLNLPRLQFAQVWGTPHVVERPAHEIAEHPAEAVVAYFALEGEGFFYHRDGCEILKPGRTVLYDADQPFMRGVSHGLKELALKVPRRTLGELTGRTADWDGLETTALVLLAEILGGNTGQASHLPPPRPSSPPT